MPLGWPRWLRGGRRPAPSRGPAHARGGRPGRPYGPTAAAPRHLPVGAGVGPDFPQRGRPLPLPQAPGHALPRGVGRAQGLEVGRVGGELGGLGRRRRWTGVPRASMTRPMRRNPPSIGCAGSGCPPPRSGNSSTRCLSWSRRLSSASRTRRGASLQRLKPPAREHAKFGPSECGRRGAVLLGEVVEGGYAGLPVLRGASHADSGPLRPIGRPLSPHHNAAF